MVTKDGKLQCTRADPSGCTCQPTRDAAPAPARPTIGNASLIVAAMALRHLNDRLGNGGSDIDGRFAEAEAKRVAMAKEIHIDKIKKLAAAHEEKRNPTPDEPPVDPNPDDRDKYGAGRFRSMSR
jgi:hypothetical protein